MVSGVWVRMHLGMVERTPPPRRSDALLRGGGITRTTVRALPRDDDMRVISLGCTVAFRDVRTPPPRRSDARLRGGSTTRSSMQDATV